MILEIIVVFVGFLSIAGVIYNAFLMVTERSSSSSTWSNILGVGAVFCASCWTKKGNHYRLRMLFSLIAFIFSLVFIEMLSG